MKIALFLTALTLVAACGANGAPVSPQDVQPKTGISVTGDARIGVTGRF